jgi:hypothetical protein
MKKGTLPFKGTARVGRTKYSVQCPQVLHPTRARACTILAVANNSLGFRHA